MIESPPRRHADADMRLPANPQLWGEVELAPDREADTGTAREGAFGRGKRGAAELVAVAEEAAANDHERRHRMRGGKKIEGEIPGHDDVAIVARSPEVDQLGPDRQARQEIPAG